MIRALVAISVKRRVSVLMVALAVVAFGQVGFSRLTLSLLPDISYPSITVETDFTDAAPGEVENLITKPVEEAVGVLAGLREIHSVSRAGRSEVTLDFGWDANMDELALEVREKLDRLFLPDEAKKPLVLRYDPALDPIVRIALTGTDDLTLLRRVAEKRVKEALETLPGVAAAKVKGGVEEEVHVELDQGKIAALNLTPEDVGAAIRDANINRPGGALKSSDSQYLVRTLNEFDSVEEISGLAINRMGDAPIKLADVALVRWGSKDREEIVRVDGAESVEIAIFKEGDANSVTVARAIRAAVDRMPQILPRGMDLVILFDQARFIERALNEVRDALLLGGFLAIIVVFLFLRDLRPTLIIATSIPLSLVACFVLMYKLDVSLNLMSLGGLTLGIGMLVDSSIVVLEAIDRHRRGGATLAAVAITGASEVGGAVIASTLTTVAVFFPIVFVEGIAGQLFRDQALTVTFSLIASLIVSLSVIPMLSSLGRGRGATSPDVQGWMARTYERVIRGALRLRWTVLAVAALAFALAIAKIPSLGRELIPALSEGEFYFEATLPEGSPLAATDRQMAAMEAAAVAVPGVDRTYATIGSRLVAGGQAMRATGENLSQLNVVMANRDDEAGETLAAERLRTQFEQIPSLEVKLGRPSFFSLKTPIELVFFGDDLQQLRDYAQQLRPVVAAVPGVVDLRSSIEAGTPELEVRFDRDLVASLGLSIHEVAATLQNRVQGSIVSRLKVEDRQIDIRVRNREEDRKSFGEVENLVVANRGGVPVKLASLASIRSARGPAEIHRIQQSRAAILSADIAARSLGDVVTDLRAAVLAHPPPPGVVFEAGRGGQSEEMAVSFQSLRFAFALAVFLVYLVMAGTFESLIHPLIILVTIPLALIGVVLGLLTSGATISVISLIGTIFLAGIVVNNAIVLVDAINRHRRSGAAKIEAVVKAGGERLRPILMTTLTTVLGLLPMAIGFGEGAELRAPMAIVIIWGLMVSTILTLIVVPAVYAIVPSRVRTEAEEQLLEAAIGEGI